MPPRSERRRILSTERGISIQSLDMRYLCLAALVGLGACIVVEDRPPAREVVIDLRAHYRVMWVEYYGCPPVWIDTCYGYGWGDDDVAVALFLAYHAHVDIGVVVGHRRAGCSWWDVTLRLKLEPTIYFVEVPPHVHVGPPYGHAYGYFRKQEPNYVFVDADIHNLVHLHVTSRYYGLEPAAVIHHREEGRSWEVLVKENHGKGKGTDARGNSVKQETPGHSDEHGKGKPNDDDDKGKPPGKGKGKGPKDK